MVACDGEPRIGDVVADHQRPFGLARRTPVRYLDGRRLLGQIRGEGIQRRHLFRRSHAEVGQLGHMCVHLFGVTSGESGVEESANGDTNRAAVGIELERGHERLLVRTWVGAVSLAVRMTTPVMMAAAMT